MSIQPLKLASFRKNDFSIPEDLIYLTGNSLGPCPVKTMARLHSACTNEWTDNLAGAWKKNDWLGTPTSVGKKIQQLFNAEVNTITVCDNTSTNLFKLLSAGLTLNSPRKIILTDIANFSTDIYIAQGLTLANQHIEVRIVPSEHIISTISNDVAIVLLSHVNHRTGEAHSIDSINQKARNEGALTLWDLSHSAGIMNLDFNRLDMDMAVGCGYKYLCGGPGAPAFIYVNSRLQSQLKNPIQGWLGHAEPFSFSPTYVPASGVTQFQVGTPPVLSLIGLDEGMNTLRESRITDIETDSRTLQKIFLEEINTIIHRGNARLPFQPHDKNMSGHIGLELNNAQNTHLALSNKNIATEYRHPNLIRISFNPLFTSIEDILITAAAITKSTN